MKNKYENHICRFNDGEQICECYVAGRDDQKKECNSGKRMYEIGREDVKRELREKLKTVRDRAMSQEDLYDGYYETILKLLE